MQIVFDDGGGTRDVDVRVNNPTATVADLIAALAPGAEAPGVLVGARWAGSDLGLTECGLYDGAVVRLAASATPARRPPAADGLVLDAIGGLDAGRRAPLPPGTLVVGAGAECDVSLSSATVSGRHAQLEVTPAGAVTVVDLGSRNGTWLGDAAVTAPTALDEGRILRLGAVQLVARRPRTDDRPLAVDPLRHVTAAGTLPFNRPPRASPPPARPPLPMPKPPAEGSGRAVFSIVSVIVPVAFAAVMMIALHSAIYGLFALLGPVMAIGTYFEGRRRGRTTSKRERQRYDRELRELTTAMTIREQEEVASRTEALPDLAEVVRRATVPSSRLWERRPNHGDFLQVRAGLGSVPWDPPVERPAVGATPESLTALLDSASTLAECPVAAELGGGGVVGLVGDRGAALALARALVLQAAVHQGPADVTIGVFTRAGHASAWDWAKWLPHSADPASGNRLLSADHELSVAILQGLAAGGPRQGGPTLLLVLDDEALTEGRRSAARAILRGGAGPVAGIVIAATADRLPALCTTIVDLRGPDGEASLFRPEDGLRIDGFLASGVAEDVARLTARALARFEDPELEVAGAGLPDRVRLLPLLGVDQVDAAAVAARWAEAGDAPNPAAPIGVTEDDVFVVDLVRDGPHGLVAGTTGAGKSELLRTLVAGLAASVDPDHLTFLLIDFKGGSAFDESSRLPHTVGLVTDLDQHLAERALRCLEAELRYRERVLREASAIDLPQYLRGGTDREPLPRLLVVIDEFATLKAELPDFVDALVGVAQRGRSLGVHLLLATQRPSGAVSENIRANTNLRIALRVQDAGDSTDVIGVADAASLPRSRPGRALVRLGPGEVVPIQTALSTTAADRSSLAPVEIGPFRFGPRPEGGGPNGAVAIGGRTDLAALVDAVTAAFEASSRPRPRRPWPDPLPDDVDLDTLGPSPDEAVVAFALADDPDAQAQYPAGWRPADGNLLLYGIVGSGTTTALAALALVLARTESPARLHLYVVDYGAGDLAPLGGLPHTGAYIGATERERQQRLVRTLRAELDRRRAAGGRTDDPRIVVLIDGFAALHAEFDDVAGMPVLDEITRLVADGPEVGILTVIAADRAGAVPAAISSTVRQRLLFRLADAYEYGTFGLSTKAVPPLGPGRAVFAETGQLVQVARSRDLASAVDTLAASAPETGSRPAAVGTLPTTVSTSVLAGRTTVSRRPWFVALGLGEHDLAPAGLTVYEGEHVLVAGPARSGRSTALATIAGELAGARPDLETVVVAGPRSPLAGAGAVDGTVLDPGALTPLTALVDDAAGSPMLVLVDDAEAIDDPAGVLAGLLSTPRPGLLLAAAARNDVLRSAYSHWTRSVRRSKLGILLQPDVDLDGDLFGVALPRRAPVAMVAGRGYLVNGPDVQLVQVATRIEA